MNKYYCFNRNENYKYVIENIIHNRSKEIYDFFGMDVNSEFNYNIYIYDTIEELVKGMRDRGFKDMPDYMCACQKDEDNSINFFEPKDNPKNDELSKKEYEQVIFHELIHAIQFNIYGKQPEWLTEGIAKYLDGTYKKGIKYLLENYIHKINIPNMYELENEFGNHDYDSYDYAYVMVSYLIEILGKEEFLNLIKDETKLNEISKDLVIKAICYYNKKYFNNEFYNEDLLKPQFLFHGSPLLLNEIDLRQSKDSSENQNNIDNAIFVTSSFLIASAYSFKDHIKQDSEGLNWNFKVNSMEKLPIMEMENVVVNENIEGYIYVFVNDGTFKNEPGGSLQFKSYKKLIPICCKNILFKDYKYLYKYESKMK